MGLLQISPLFRFPSTTLVVPLGLLASQRGWNLLYSLGAWPLHCGRGGGILHHHETLLVVPHYGQSASEFPPIWFGASISPGLVLRAWQGEECKESTDVLGFSFLRDSQLRLRCLLWCQSTSASKTNKKDVYMMTGDCIVLEQMSHSHCPWKYFPRRAHLLFDLHSYPLLPTLGPSPA